MIAAPACAKSDARRSTGFTIRCTSIGTLTWGFSAAHTMRADGQIRDVVVVHHVEMDQIGASRDHRTHLFAEAREIGGENRRCNLAALHRRYNRTEIPARGPVVGESQ